MRSKTCSKFSYRIVAFVSVLYGVADCKAARHKSLRSLNLNG